ncbi:MAG: HEPN domain-containing protein [Polyangiaceae bacterium]|nr:HEPN domain-containing protein [Polyangiaceae bacterium]
MTDENRRIQVAAEVARAEEAHRATHELLRLGLLNDAVSRAYYSALHYAMALLLTEGVEPQTHRGVGAMLGQPFIVPRKLPVDRAKDLARLEQFRSEADYNRFFVLSPEGAAEEAAVADRFRAAARAYLKDGAWLVGD